MRHALGRELGRGGVGCVYAARAANGAGLAIKVLHRSLLDDPRMVMRFAAEADAARRVTHCNVVCVLEHGTMADGLPYLVMKHAPGRSLRSLIHDEGELAWPRVARIGSQILAGLAAIHRAGLVHGDMKSDNVLVDDSGGLDRITIIDLGLARPPGQDPPGLDTRMMSGTPAYMAPELLDEEPITVAAELYAVGAILYEMMTATTPFGGGSITDIVERQLADAVVAPSVRRREASAPVPLDHAILRALAKDPDRRHLNAGLFATALERASLATAGDEQPTRQWARRRAPALGTRQVVVAPHLVETRRLPETGTHVLAASVRRALGSRGGWRP